MHHRYLLIKTIIFHFIVDACGFTLHSPRQHFLHLLSIKLLCAGQLVAIIIFTASCHGFTGSARLLWYPHNYIQLQYMLKTICDHKTDIFPLKLKLWTEKKKPNCITVYWVCFSWFQCPILASILFIQSYQYSKHHGLPQEKVGMNMWSQKKPNVSKSGEKKKHATVPHPPNHVFLFASS